MITTEKKLYSVFDFVLLVNNWLLGRLIANEECAGRFTTAGKVDLAGERWEKWEEDARRAVIRYLMNDNFRLDASFHDEHVALALEAKALFAPMMPYVRD